MPRHGRYLRPYLEIEYDQQALTRASECCRYIPVVVRLCAVPEEVRLTLLFERIRKQAQDETYLDDYEVHPRQPWKRQVPRRFAHYHEYHLQLLARPHTEETGAIHIKIESPSFTLLSEGTFRFDSRQPEPIRSNFRENSFRNIRLVPFLRSEEARDALHGLYPAFLSKEHGGIQQPTTSTTPSLAEASPLKNWWLTNHSS